MSVVLTPPLRNKDISGLKAGDRVYITGTIYTARDTAHKKMADLIIKNKKLPFPLKGQIIYYTGPTPAKPGTPIGSAGPTTSYRMDAYTPQLLAKGLKGMIGKGKRSENVIKAIRRYKAVYLAAIGGAGALISKYIKKCELTAYPELGPEAIYRLYVENFAVIVINDIKGRDLYRKIIR